LSKDQKFQAEGKPAARVPNLISVAQATAEQNKTISKARFDCPPRPFSVDLDSYASDARSNNPGIDLRLLPRFCPIK
jgi:hypothetical protein